MKLRELLNASRIIVPLRARKLRDATTQLAQALVRAGAVADEARLVEILKSEWPEDIVSVSGRAFLPHFRTDAARELAVALGVAAQPLCRGNDPNRCARVVVLVIAPTRDASKYLRAMSAVAQALASDEVLDGLHRATGPADILALPGLGETAVPSEVTVRDVMTTGVLALPPQMKLREAAGVMLGRDVSAVPVTSQDGVVVGLLTDRHLLRYLLPQTVQQLGTGQMRAMKRRTAKGSPVDPGDVPVRDVMDRSVLCLAEDQSVADVAALMLSKEVDRFPVTRDGALVGFLTRGDIVRKLLGS